MTYATADRQKINQQWHRQLSLWVRGCCRKKQTVAKGTIRSSHKVFFSHALRYASSDEL
jgi:hypothetical protein